MGGMTRGLGEYLPPIRVHCVAPEPFRRQVCVWDEDVTGNKMAITFFRIKHVK